MLANLRKAKGSTKSRKRVGRGTGSGLGKTAGRGTKGQKARSGGKVRPGYEGGQMPLHRRLPKRGFTNVFRREYAVVNLKDIDRVKDAEVIDPDLMRKLRLAGGDLPIKVLANGELSRPVTVRAHRFSEAARQKVERAGGKAEIL